MERKNKITKVLMSMIGVFLLFLLIPMFSYDPIPPTLPVLYFPLDNKWTNTKVFTWSDSTDLGTGVSEYHIQIDNEPTFSPPYVYENKNLKSSSVVTPTGLKENVCYWWRVRAKDKSGNYSAWSSTRSFRLDYTSPVFTNFARQKANGTWETKDLPIEITPPINCRINVQDKVSGLRIGRTELIPIAGCILYLPLNGNIVDKCGHRTRISTRYTLIRGIEAKWMSTTTWKSTGGLERFIKIDKSMGPIAIPDGNTKLFDFVDRSPFSISLWMKPTMLIGGRRLVRKILEPSLQGWDSELGGDGRLYFVRRGGDKLDLLESPPVVSTNTWTHVVYTYDGSVLRAYVNGILVSSKTSTLLMSDTTAPLSIGDRIWLDRRFHGFMDEIAIWNRALTPEEIAVMYNGAAVKYSTDGGLTWTIKPEKISITGTDGTTDIQLITVTKLPLIKGDKNLVKFIIQDTAGNVVESEPYTIRIR